MFQQIIEVPFNPTSLATDRVWIVVTLGHGHVLGGPFGSFGRLGGFRRAAPKGLDSLDDALGNLGHDRL